MKKLISILIWISSNCAEIVLAVVFAISVMPFFVNNHGHNYYTFLGGWLSFCSTLFFRFQKKKSSKESAPYSIMGIIILALGVTSVFLIGSKKGNDPYTNFDLFITTYLGAMSGMIIATFLNDLLDSSKKEKELLKQQVQNLNKTKVKLNWIPVTKKLPYEDKEVLCKNSKGAYFVGYLTSENVGHKIIYQCNSGDEGMNDVVCWIELSEIDKTVPDELLIK